MIYKIKKIIYKILPKSVKNSLTNQYFLDYSKLNNQERRNKLKNLNNFQFLIIENYVFIFLKLRIFFDLDKLEKEIKKENKTKDY